MVGKLEVAHVAPFMAPALNMEFKGNMGTPNAPFMAPTTGCSIIQGLHAIALLEVLQPLPAEGFFTNGAVHYL